MIEWFQLHVIHNYTNTDRLPEHTVNTQTGIMIYTGPDRRLYNHDQSLPTTLYTFYTIMYSPQNTLKYTVVYYDIYRSLPTAL